MMNRGKKIGEVLIDAGLITQSQLEESLKKQATEGKRLGEVLVNAGLLTEREIATALSEQLGLKLLDSIPGEISPEAIKLVPEDMARKHILIPLAKDGNNLVVAMSDPVNLRVIDLLQFMSGLRVQPIIAMQSEILTAINRNYRSDPIMYDKLQEFPESNDTEMTVESSKLEEPDAQTLQKASQTPPIIRLVNHVLSEAIKMRASDIHLDPQKDYFVASYRIDGTMKEILKIPKRAQEPVISRIKIMCNMKLTESRLPQEARSKLRTGSKEFELRISTIPSLYGEKITIRILGQSKELLKLEKLDLPSEELEGVKTLLTQSQGMILVTGPAGSGKTTTLYALLQALNSGTKHIMTIEDPVEYRLEGITQIPIVEKIGMSYAIGLKAILVQNPDVIMVGEIHDLETAQIALQAAQTSHLVLSTLQTDDSVSSITRLLDLGIEPSIVASSILGIIAQRTVRKVCPNCLEPYSALIETMGLEELGTYYRGKGCRLCGYTGYSGEMVIFEVLRFDRDIRELILSRTSERVIKEAAIRSGMKRMIDRAWDKVRKGLTTPDEVMSKVPWRSPESHEDQPSPSNVISFPQLEGKVPSFVASPSSLLSVSVEGKNGSSGKQNGSNGKSHVDHGQATLKSMDKSGFENFKQVTLLVEDIVKKISSGQVQPDIAKSLSDIARSLLELSHRSDIEARLDALEDIVHDTIGKSSSMISL